MPYLVMVCALEPPYIQSVMQLSLFPLGDEAEIYNPETNSWRTLSQPLPGVYRPKLFTLGNSRNNILYMITF